MADLHYLAGDADRFAVIDTETTGLYTSDRIVEIAILTIGLDGKIIDNWETLIQPERHIGAAEIHGITPSMVVHAPILSQVAGDIAERLDGACVVGHNVSFDIRMLTNEFERLDGSVFCKGYLDTRKVHSGRLVEACRQFDISLTNAHSALADAEASAGLFLAGYRFFNTTGSASQVLVRQPPTGRKCSRDTTRPTASEGCDRGEAYLRLVDEVLEDGVIDEDERQQLVELADELNLTPDEIDVLCLETVSRKLDQVLEDGVLTPEEHDELLQTIELCGVGSDIAQIRIRKFLNSAIADPEAVLRTGDEIVVTGQHPDFTRQEICSLLKSRGFTTGSSITKSRTKLLLALDPASESGKAKQARKFGIPIMALEDFATINPAD